MIVDDTDASLAAEPVALPVAAAASTEHVGRPATPQQYPHEATTPARSPAVTVDAAQPPNTPDHGSGSRADVFAQRRLRRRVARSDANERSPVQRSTRLNDVNKQVAELQAGQQTLQMQLAASEAARSAIEQELHRAHAMLAMAELENAQLRGDTGWQFESDTEKALQLCNISAPMDDGVVPCDIGSSRLAGGSRESSLTLCDVGAVPWESWGAPSRIASPDTPAFDIEAALASASTEAVGMAASASAAVIPRPITCPIVTSGHQWGGPAARPRHRPAHSSRSSQRQANGQQMAPVVQNMLQRAAAPPKLEAAQRSMALAQQAVSAGPEARAAQQAAGPSSAAAACGFGTAAQQQLQGQSPQVVNMLV